MVQVLLGEHDYNTAGETDRLRLDVVKIENHPDYNERNTNYDFALLKLGTAVDFCVQSHIRPICLPPDATQTYAGRVATVTGWGTTSSGGNLSNTLQEVELVVLTNQDCKNNYGYPSSSITNKMLCANVDGGGGDSCQVDTHRHHFLQNEAK